MRNDFDIQCKVDKQLKRLTTNFYSYICYKTEGLI